MHEPAAPEVPPAHIHALAILPCRVEPFRIASFDLLDQRLKVTLARRHDEQYSAYRWDSHHSSLGLLSRR